MRTVITYTLFTGILFFITCCPPEDYCASFDESMLTVLDNSDGEPAALNAETVSAYTLVLELKIINTINSCSNTPRNYFVNSAYATSCYNRRMYTNDTVRNVIISADKEYSSLHPVGTGLNEFFTMPLTEDLNHVEDEQTFLFYAAEPPEKEGVYTFTVKLYMTSGRVYEAVSDPINITL